MEQNSVIKCVTLQLDQTAYDFTKIKKNTSRKETSRTLINWYIIRTLLQIHHETYNDMNRILTSFTEEEDNDIISNVISSLADGREGGIEAKCHSNFFKNNPKSCSIF